MACMCVCLKEKWLADWLFNAQRSVSFFTTESKVTVFFLMHNFKIK